MDDVEKIFEPFQFDLNDKLALFPDKTEIDPKHFMQKDLWGDFGVNTYDILRIKSNELKLGMIGSNYHLLNDYKFFKFEIEETEENSKIVFNAKTGEISHKLFMVKDKIAFSEIELESIRKSSTTQYIRRKLNRSQSVNKPRINEIADIYNATKVKCSRSYNDKVLELCRHLETMMDDKVLDIRDMKLCNDFASWVVMYVRDGNLAALNNLTRIKIITHEKRPIYSIEEKAV